MHPRSTNVSSIFERFFLESNKNYVVVEFPITGWLNE